MAYKRELIVNNGSLTSYKKLLKVSDVCQLLDKSKYPATTTVNGVTYTNNGDGTITVNSLNITANAFYHLSPYSNIATKKGHKYCALAGANTDGGYCYVDVLNKNGAWVSEIVDDLYTVPADNYSFRLSIFADKNKPFGDKTYKPQLFDLTEMYGAGNEPTTVDEFKAKFPNELYDYSPRCWVKSYKTGLIAETKNLFNINALTPYTPETLPIGTAGVYNGNIISRGKSDDTTCSTGKTLRELCPDLAVGETYTLNFETTVPSSIGGQYESIHLRGVGNWWRRNTRTITEADLSAVVYVYADTDLSVYTISNFQIEKGTTATDYVPFGYL